MELLTSSGIVPRLSFISTSISQSVCCLSCGVNDLRFESRQKQELFCSSKRCIHLSVPPIGTAVVSRKYSGQDLQLTTPIPPVQKVRMGEANFHSPQIRLIAIDSGYFSFSSVDTVADPAVWLLRVATVWLVTASEMCYCSNILTVKMGKW